MWTCNVSLPRSMEVLCLLLLFQFTVHTCVTLVSRVNQMTMHATDFTDTLSRFQWALLYSGCSQLFSLSCTLLFVLDLPLHFFRHHHLLDLVRNCQLPNTQSPSVCMLAILLINNAIGIKNPLLGDDNVEAGKSNSKEIDARPVSYSYTFFHVIFALASMYSAMLLTGWTSAASDSSELMDVGWTTVWVRICTEWATAALYIWTLVAPLLFPDRDFS